MSLLFVGRQFEPQSHPKDFLRIKQVACAVKEVGVVFLYVCMYIHTTYAISELVGGGGWHVLSEQSQQKVHL